MRKEKQFEEFEELAQHSGDPLLVNFERVRGGKSYDAALAISASAVCLR